MRRCRRIRSLSTGIRAAVAGACVGFAGATSGAPAAAVEPVRLAIPIACDLAALCSIQNYVDVEAGAGTADYRCGTLTYDGHQGTDFQLRDLATMRSGIAVLAAAAGTVRASRDGVPDRGFEEWRRTGSDQNALGNAVAIVHADGSEAYYGHLRQGSVLVRQGDRVVAGQPIGLVGFSGKTEFPHLHFQLMRDGVPIDPFTGQAASARGCTASGEPQPLWQEAAQALPDYRPVILVCSGFALTVPDRKAVQDTCPALVAATDDAPALVLFAEIAGVQAGDRLRFVIRRPDGEPLVDNLVDIDRSRARQFRYVGLKRPATAWHAGIYEARIELSRTDRTATAMLIDARLALAVRAIAP